SRSINGHAVVLCAPQSDAVEVFKRESDRIHDFVTARARFDRPMFFHLLPQRKNLAWLALCLFELRYNGRRVRRADAEYRWHAPLAAPYRRCPERLRRNDLYRAFAKQTAASIEFRAQRDSTELAAVHVRNSIVLREPFIHERVIRRQKIENVS